MEFKICKAGRKMKTLEQKIGYTFKDKSLLKLALTHSSYANEMGEPSHCNERLEFLGDSVLSLVVSDYIFNNYKSRPEGELTKLRASLVCEKSLCAFSQIMDLGEYLLLGKGEAANGGRERPSILADAFEAVLAVACVSTLLVAVTMPLSLLKVSSYVVPDTADAVGFVRESETAVTSKETEAITVALRKKRLRLIILCKPFQEQIIYAGRARKEAQKHLMADVG